jgi:hypothetical protein
MMRDWFETEIEHLREFVELYEDGLLIVDVLHEGDPAPSFRTLVQLDGDVLSLIDADALSDPKFAEARDRHMAHVNARLQLLIARPRRWAIGVSLIVSGVWTGVTGVVTQSTGFATQMVGERWDEIFSVAGGFLIGTIVWPLGRRALQRLIAWRIGERSRARTNSALERLLGQVGDPEPARTNNLRRLLQNATAASICSCELAVVVHQ